MYWVCLCLARERISTCRLIESRSGLIDGVPSTIGNKLYCRVIPRLEIYVAISKTTMDFRSCLAKKIQRVEFSSRGDLDEIRAKYARQGYILALKNKPGKQTRIPGSGCHS
jgi:hypothetical protein